MNSRSIFSTLPVCALSAMLALAGCGKSGDPKAAGELPERPAVETAFLKKGEGLSIPESLRKTIGLEIVEVTERTIVPSFKVPLQVIRGADSIRTVSNPGQGSELSGWLTAAQAAAVRPGMDLRIVPAPTSGSGGSEEMKPEPGRITRVEKAPLVALDDYEMTVESAALYGSGARLEAVVQGEATGSQAAVPSVPASAILRTAEGTFVYAVNGTHLMRTPVKLGAANDEFVEIADGLYAGDEIAATPVMTLWLTELQTLRAGHSCCEIR